ncbi:MAG: hypothetical protein D6734_08360, partial [Candidatus Schekmanbacteria bacterium]
MKNHFLTQSFNKNPVILSIFSWLCTGMIIGIADSLWRISDTYEIGAEKFRPFFKIIYFIKEFFFYYGLGSFILSILLFLSLFYLSKKNILISSVICTAAAIFFPFLYKFNKQLRFDFLPAEVNSHTFILEIIVCGILIFSIFLLLSYSILNKKYAISVGIGIFLLLLYAFPSFEKYEEERYFSKEAEKPHKRVILITMDTTRYDHLSLFGYNRNTSPNLIEIAKEGVLFTNAYSQVPETDPSHTTILTGTYPQTHGLYENGMRISNQSLSSLAEWFKKKGFRTAAITSRDRLNPEKLGIKGFDYINFPKLPQSEKYKWKYSSSLPADRTYERAKRWIDNNYHTDFFLWVHFFDPHWEYNPPAPYNSKFNSGYKGKVKKYFGFVFDKRKQFTKDEIRYAESLYDGEIAYMDHYIGKLTKYIEEKIPSSSTPPIFVITADHGEILGERQESIHFVFCHSLFSYHSLIRIPLIFRWDGYLPKNLQIKNIVESVDIAPTIVNLIDPSAKFECDGNSFYSLFFNKNSYGKNCAFSMRAGRKSNFEHFTNDEFSITTDHWHLIKSCDSIELFNIENDVFEMHNIAKSNPAQVSNILSNLNLWIKKHPKA